MAKRNGIREWIFQRVSNVVIFAYGIFYIFMVMSMGDASYSEWVAMHSGALFKIVSTIALVIAMLNSLLAGWQIGTDYTQKVSIPGFGVIFHAFYTVGSIVFLLFGFKILWG